MAEPRPRSTSAAARTAQSSCHSRRNPLISCRPAIVVVLLEAPHQIGQPQQASNREPATPRRDHQERIHRRKIRPLHRQGDQPTRRIQHVDEVLPPVAASLHKLEGLTEPRMERMGHPDLGSPRILGIKRT